MGETIPSNGSGRAFGTGEIRERATLEIASVVADAKGCEPWELEPLSQVVDPDSIEELLLETPALEFEIGFDYAGGRVTVTSEGRVTFESAA